MHLRTRQTRQTQMVTRRTMSNSCRTDSQTRACHWMVLQAFLNPSELDLGQALNLVSQARTRPETTFLTTLYPTQEWDTNQSDYRCWPAHLPSRMLIGAGSGGCPLTVEAGQAAVPVVSTKAESPVNRVSSVRWRQMRKSWTSCCC